MPSERLEPSKLKRRDEEAMRSVYQPMNEENSPRQTEIEQRMDRAMVRAAEAYEANTILRAAVAGIPLIGGGVDVILSSEAQRAGKARIFKLIEEMEQRMEQYVEEAINQEYLASDEFLDLVIKAFESAARTRDEEKIRSYARILTESAVLIKQGGYSPEEYLHLIADLTPLELRVARNFYGSGVHESGRVLPEGESWRAWREQVCSCLEIDEATLSMSLSRIAATGLAEPVTLGSDQSGTWQWHGEPGDPSYYRVTPAFRKLMEFLGLDE